MFMLDLSENIEIANEGYIPIDLIKLASVPMDPQKIAEEWSKFNGCATTTATTSGGTITLFAYGFHAQ